MTKNKNKIRVLVTVAAIIIVWNIYIIQHVNPLADQRVETIKKVLSCAMMDLAYLVFWRFFDRIVSLPVELFQNRELIWKLSLNDFKSKYSGNYLGIFWAFVQPIVTVLVYWFVFAVMRGDWGLDGNGYPFVLWLIVGIVPWFFFSDALSQGTSAMLSYEYLVKKVVFKISILPIIKVMSAMFIHIFFLIFSLILITCYGYYPDIYSIQVIYFSFCMFALTLALSYITCSIVVFFRDLGQIISIALQVGIWITPIMWNIETLPRYLQVIFKLNPVFYVVDGYRMALLDKMWFWEHFFSTAYFWIFTVAAFLFGALIFKRLKVHFADVL